MRSPARETIIEMRKMAASLQAAKRARLLRPSTSKARRNRGPGPQPRPGQPQPRRRWWWPTPTPAHSAPATAPFAPRRGGGPTLGWFADDLPLPHCRPGSGCRAIKSATWWQHVHTADTSPPAGSSTPNTSPISPSPGRRQQRVRNNACTATSPFGGVPGTAVDPRETADPSSQARPCRVSIRVAHRCPDRPERSLVHDRLRQQTGPNGWWILKASGSPSTNLYLTADLLDQRNAFRR